MDLIKLVDKKMNYVSVGGFVYSKNIHIPRSYLMYDIADISGLEHAVL
jgi:hypothetical protein